MLQELVTRADQRGYVTFEDVLEVLDTEGEDVLTIEAILNELDEAGIELRQETEVSDVYLVAEEFEPDFEPEELLQDPGVGDINAVSADDPVGLYFRQMAQEPLLTAPRKSSWPSASKWASRPAKRTLASCIAAATASRGWPISTS